MSTVFSVNFVNSIKPSDRQNKMFKKTCNMSFVPGIEVCNTDMKPYTLKKLKIYSYILDIDPIIDPKDTYNSLWSIPFLSFMRKAREEYASNLMGLTVGESHTIAYTDNSKFYNWGGSNLFQLGFFDSFSKTYPKENDLNIPLNSANFVMAGNNHTLMYSAAHGKLLSWGDNSYGQLGLGHFSSIKGLLDISHLLKNKEAKQLDSKCDLNALLLEDGTATVWPFENPYNPDPSPMEIKFHQEKIATVATGFDFVLFATDNGRLFSMGKTNSYGELGHGDFNPRLEPTLVESLANSGDMSVQISCGFKHCIMKNQNGKIFTWGWGERGQLGHEHDRNVPFPKKVLFRNSGGYSYQALNVQAGYRSSYCLLDERRFFVWGTNGRYTKVLAPTEYTDAGCDEIYYKRADFRPLKVCTTWSKSASITYMVVGDVRYLDNLKFSEREVLLKNVYSQWEKNYYDCKPMFDKRVGVHLDSNIMGHHLEKLQQSRMQTTTGNLKSTIGVSKTMKATVGRSRTPIAQILKKKAEEEKSLNEQKLSKEKLMVLRNMEKIDKELSKADTKTKKIGNKENSISRITADPSGNSRMKTPVKKAAERTMEEEPTDERLLRDKYNKVQREMLRILAKRTNEWTPKEKAFVDEARRMFKG
jgi:Regulator of chromosome condensation (RCC1) repeat